MAGWAAVLGFAALTPETFGQFALATRALTAHPSNWIQTNLTTRRRTKPAGLIESCMQGVGAPPQTLGRLRRKNVSGGSAPRAPLGLHPKPRFGGGFGGRSPPAGSGVELGSEGWVGAPTGVWGRSTRQHSCGEAARGLWRSPNLPPPSGYATAWSGRVEVCIQYQNVSSMIDSCFYDPLAKYGPYFPLTVRTSSVRSSKIYTKNSRPPGNTLTSTCPWKLLYAVANGLP